MRTFGRSAVVLGIFLLAAAARFAPAAEFTHRNSNPVRKGPEITIHCSIPCLWEFKSKSPANKKAGN